VCFTFIEGKAFFFLKEVQEKHFFLWKNTRKALKKYLEVLGKKTEASNTL
jgi:hypothetical protein